MNRLLLVLSLFAASLCAQTACQNPDASGIFTNFGSSLCGIVESGLSYPTIAVTQGGTPANTYYLYCVVGLDNSNLSRAICGPTQTGPSTLNGTNFNTITIGAWSSTAPFRLPIGSCNVYRVQGGASTGVIGTISSCSAGGALNDTGLSGDSTTVPTDTSGTVVPAAKSSTFTCHNYASATACLNAAKTYVGSQNNGTDRAALIYFDAGTQLLGSTYTLAGGMQINGVMPRINVVSGQNPDIVEQQDGGTWFDCGASVCFNGSNLRGIAFNNVGFQNFTKVFSFGSSGVDGISFSTFNNTIALGLPTCCTSGFGFEFFNFQHITGSANNFYHVNAGMHLVNQSSTIQGGNANFFATFIDTYTKSAANGNSAVPGLWLQVLDPPSGTTQQLNLINFYGLQVNSYAGDNTADNIYLQGNTNAKVVDIGLLNIDSEGTALNLIHLSQAASCQISVISGILNGAGGVWANLDANSNYNSIMSTVLAFTLTNSGAGNQFSGILTSFSGNTPHGYFQVAGALPMVGSGGSKVSFPAGVALSISAPVELDGSGSNIYLEYSGGTSNVFLNGFGSGSRAFQVRDSNASNAVRWSANFLTGATTEGTVCASAASPAACGASPTGAVTIAAGATTVVVNTTSVTANSIISLTPDDSVTIASTTCNSTLATLVGGIAVTARTAGTSFTISYNGTIAVNPLCISYRIVN